MLWRAAPHRPPALRTLRCRLGACSSRGRIMLHYTVVFFFIALIAALFGFGGIAASAAGIAKILFFAFVILAVASFVMGLIRRG